MFFIFYHVSMIAKVSLLLRKQLPLPFSGHFFLDDRDWLVFRIAST